MSADILPGTQEFIAKDPSVREGPNLQNPIRSSTKPLENRFIPKPNGNSQALPAAELIVPPRTGVDQAVAAPKILTIRQRLKSILRGSK